jgi:hypothetical protein
LKTKTIQGIHRVLEGATAGHPQATNAIPLPGRSGTRRPRKTRTL